MTTLGQMLQDMVRQQSQQVQQHVIQVVQQQHRQHEAPRSSQCIGGRVTNIRGPPIFIGDES